MDSQRPIIIVKKKVGHAGHHGGAWKVAYADFVTAMMALFIVLWLLNTSKPVREAIAGYFKDPTGTGKESGTTQSGKGESLSVTTVTKDNIADLKEKLQKAIEQMTNFDKLKNQIAITVTPDGLRIELLETASGTFFNLGSPTPNANGKELLIRLAQELGKVPNKITIEGHTDAKPYSGKGDYSNWELSADRANAARRIMQENGLRSDQVSQVRGYADQQLRDPKNPFDPSNRRISVIVHYLEQKQGQPASSVPAAAGPKPSSASPAPAENQAAPMQSTKE
jgi:chemotaxis protein MotB